MSTASKVASTLRKQFAGAHEVLEGTMEGVTQEQAHWSPPGTANPLGATYAHVLLTEDMIINATVKGEAPLFAGKMAGKVGISEPPPGPSPEKPGLPNWSGWGRQVQVDLAALREYAQAVYAATDAYLGSATDEALERSLDLSALGAGEQTVGQLLAVTILANTHWHTGEIACLKGLQGVKGYPF